MLSIKLVQVHNNVETVQLFHTIREARANMKLQMIEAGIPDNFFTPHRLQKKEGDILFNKNYASYETETDKYYWEIN